MSDDIRICERISLVFWMIRCVEVVGGQIAHSEARAKPQQRDCSPQLEATSSKPTVHSMLSVLCSPDKQKGQKAVVVGTDGDVVSLFAATYGSCSVPRSAATRLFSLARIFIYGQDSGQLRAIHSSVTRIMQAMAYS